MSARSGIGWPGVRSGQNSAPAQSARPPRTGSAASRDIHGAADGRAAFGRSISPQGLTPRIAAQARLGTGGADGGS